MTAMFCCGSRGRILLAALLLGLAAAPGSARATFPGANGKLATDPSREVGLLPGVHVANPDGSSVTRVTNNPDQRETDPSFSPDGASITFAFGHGAQGGIGVIDVDGTDQKLFPGASGDENPEFGPDNRTIIFGRRDAVAYDIWAMDRDGTNLRNLTNTPDFEYNPSFSPDGSKIVFVSNAGISTMNPDGSDRKVILPGGRSPSYSPDGSRIVLEGSGVISSMNADGSDVKQLTTSGFDHRPVFSPDGRKIAFASERDPSKTLQTGIYVMNADGSDQVRVIDNPVDSPASRTYSVSWQPLIASGPGAGSIPPPGAAGTKPALCPKGTSASVRCYIDPTGRLAEVGTTLAETFTGTASADRISPFAGNDTVFGLGGPDLMSGGEGHDRLDGGAGNDRLNGNAGNDRLSGGSGRDSISGGKGRDTLSGGPGRDRLNCGTGRDKVSASGKDRVGRSCERS